MHLYQNYLSWAGADSHAEMLRPKEMSNHQKKKIDAKGDIEQRAKSRGSPLMTVTNRACRGYVGVQYRFG
jgi:hypothetical protein